MQLQNKKLTIIAGPNGSGKTTFVQYIYPEIVSAGLFLNADNFAREMNPDNVSKVALAAGKRFLRELDARIQSNYSVIIETTLSGKTLLKKIQSAKTNGFVVRLMFLWISTAELCDFRVKGRVASGGHNIPLHDIRRRYKRGLNNIPLYLQAIDEFEILRADQKPKLICCKNMGLPLQIVDEDLYQEFEIVSQQVE